MDSLFPRVHSTSLILSLWMKQHGPGSVRWRWHCDIAWSGCVKPYLYISIMTLPVCKSGWVQDGSRVGGADTTDMLHGGRIRIRMTQSSSLSWTFKLLLSGFFHLQFQTVVDGCVTQNWNGKPKAWSEGLPSLEAALAPSLALWLSSQEKFSA